MKLVNNFIIIKPIPYTFLIKNILNKISINIFLNFIYKDLTAIYGNFKNSFPLSSLPLTSPKKYKIFTLQNTLILVR